MNVIIFIKEFRKLSPSLFNKLTTRLQLQSFKGRDDFWQCTFVRENHYTHTSRITSSSYCSRLACLHLYLSLWQRLSTYVSMRSTVPVAKCAATIRTFTFKVGISCVLPQLFDFTSVRSLYSAPPAMLKCYLP